MACRWLLGQQQVHDVFADWHEPGRTAWSAENPDAIQAVDAREVVAQHSWPLNFGSGASVNTMLRTCEWRPSAPTIRS